MFVIVGRGTTQFFRAGWSKHITQMKMQNLRWVNAIVLTQFILPFHIKIWFHWVLFWLNDQRFSFKSHRENMRSFVCIFQVLGLRESVVTTERLQPSVLIGAIRHDYVAITIRSPPKKECLGNKHCSYFNSKSCFTQMSLAQFTANMYGEHIEDEEEILA